MARFRSFFLIAVLAIPFAGAFGWFTGRLVVVRHAVAARLASDTHTGPLVKLAFALGEAADLLEWEHPREFRYRGEMYDVARTDETADSIRYWCHHDVKETSLRREITKWLARTFGGGNNDTPVPVRQLVHFLANLYPPVPVGFGEEIRMGRQDRPEGSRSIQDAGITVRPPVPPPWRC